MTVMPDYWDILQTIPHTMLNDPHEVMRMVIAIRSKTTKEELAKVALRIAIDFEKLQMAECDRKAVNHECSKRRVEILRQQ
jgi:hypothetical protein